MSSILVISTIIFLLVALISYAFISQTIATRRKQKQRLLTALKIRAKDFKFMIGGFPPNFLSKDLNVLVHRCLVDVLEQLAKLDPSEKLHIDELTLFNKQMEDAQRKPKSATRAKIENPQQTKEIKRLLQSLNQFIANLLKRNTITSGQYKDYSEQIKTMVVQMTVDSYLLNAKQSQSAGKLRLAIHYFSLAKKLLAKESGKQNYQKQIQQLNGVIAKLEEKAGEAEAPQAGNTAAEASEGNTLPADAEDNEWNEFGKEDDDWKKKSVYD
jgi:predicted  nucleic acid-binding Zn-ribbon protein